MDDSSLDIRLLLAFDTADAQFARGFEVGRLWTMLRADPNDELSEYVHASNAEMLLRLAEATGRKVRSQDIDDTWLLATFTPVVALDSNL
jgi:hypothetical protein